MELEEISRFPIEVIVEILLNLPYRSVLSYCSTHRFASRVCRDDYFWKLKVDRDFPGVSHHKPSVLSYHKQYQELDDMHGPNDAATFGRLDLLILLSREDSYPDQVGMNLAAWKGHLNVLKWSPKIHPNIVGANWALMTGHLDILKWMEENLSVLPDSYEPDKVARDGHVEILEWMDQRGYSPPTQAGADLAVRYGHLNVLKWMDQKGKKLGIPLHPSQRGANSAAENGELAIIKWMEEREYPLPDKDGIAWAVENNRQNVLLWAREKGYLGETD